MRPRYVITVSDIKRFASKNPKFLMMIRDKRERDVAMSNETHVLNRNLRRYQSARSEPDSAKSDDGSADKDKTSSEADPTRVKSEKAKPPAVSAQLAAKASSYRGPERVLTPRKPSEDQSPQTATRSLTTIQKKMSHD